MTISPEYAEELGRQIDELEAENERLYARLSAGTGGLTPGLMNATTVSCTGLDITIACDDHDIKDALMDVLVDAAYTPAQPHNARWAMQESGPSDGFECYYILKDGLQIAEVIGPQNVENTTNLQELVAAANSAAHPPAAPVEKWLEDPRVKEALHRRPPAAPVETETRFHTDEDREYARGLLEDMDDEQSNAVDSRINIAAQWFCKARVETARRVAKQHAQSSGNVEAPTDALINLVNHQEQRRRRRRDGEGLAPSPH